MKRVNKILSAIALMFLPVSTAWAGWAAPTTSGGAPTSFSAVVTNIINWILGFVSVIATAAIIWGGIQYLTAGGDENAMKNAKKTLTFAIIGLIIAGLSYAIVTLIVEDIITEGAAGEDN